MKTPKTRMTLDDKHELYIKHISNPSTKYSDLAIWAAESFGLVSIPTKSAICKAIKHNATKSQRADSHARTRERRVSRPDIELQLVQWVLRCEELGVCITGDLIRKQADVFSNASGITTNLKFSKGWLHKFQRKHGFTSKRQRGEAGSVPQAVVESGRAKMLQITAGYTPSNIFNLDETSFLYCLSPHRSITRNCVPEGTNLSNINLQLLPPNTTPYLQPQDAGIIASFKAKVKQRQLQNALDQIDSVMAGRQDRLYEVPLVEAMGWAKDAWRDVTETTIKNCWARTGILDEGLSVFARQLSGMAL
ncbi:Aste57867_11126 [Aphanomyces stellatus]|uniref:Aste57867_11126 protein n=1 Tax=Aphanomyces stellatus TaxID=120398 RepID=A0A485KS18_9STRA|nr:hypothetical protein As57867_011084 [Aphanomyces stellatus]VFT87993.1 Aste57867_11126 [Aphanomyces stellatus]